MPKGGSALLGNSETIGEKFGHSSKAPKLTPGCICDVHWSKLWSFIQGNCLHYPQRQWGNSFAGDNHVNLINDRSDVLDKKIWFQLKLSEGDSMVIDLLSCGYSHPSQRCFFSNLQPDLFVRKQRKSSNSWNKTNAVEIMCNTSDDLFKLLVILLFLL